MKLGNLLPLLLFVVAPALAQPASQRSVRVVMDDNYPPFVFSDNQGNLQGILVDEWRLWQKRTGINAEIHGMDWGEALGRMKAGEFDVIDTLFKTQERTAYWAFSEPYARIEVSIFFHKDISGITDLKSLNGFPVAAKAGDAAVALLEQNGIATVLLFTNYEAIVEAAKAHKVNVFVMDKPPALYFLSKLGMQEEFRQSAPVNVGEFHRAVKRGDVALLRTIEEGFASLDPGERKRIQEKWYGKTIGGLPNLRYLGYVAASALLLLLGLAVWNVALNRLVNRRTAALRESESRLRALLDHMPDWVWLKDTNSRYVTANAPYAQAVKCALEALPGRTDAELWPGRDTRQFVADDQAVIQSGQPKLVTEELTDARGNHQWLETSKAPVRNSEGETIGTVGIARDITERKRAEEALDKSEQKFRGIFENAPIGIFQSTIPGRLISVNATGTRMFGYDSPEDFAAAATDMSRQLFVSAEQRQAIVREALGCRTFVRDEVKYRRKDGSVFIANLSMRAVRNQRGEAVMVEGFVEDISHRKRAEAELSRSNRTLRMISECNQVLVRATDEAELLQAICRLVVKGGGYRMAWVGFAEQDEARSVRPVAHAGFETGYLDTVNTTWADTERGGGPTSTAIRTGQAIIARNIPTDPSFGPWRQAAIQRGYAASATLPLRSGEVVLGALMVYAAEPDSFDAAEVALLTELADDLAYGITVLRTRIERERVEEQLHLLSAHLLQVQDVERRHLARELHDTTAQHLAALTLNLANLKRLCSATSEPVQALCRDSIQLANRAAQEIRTHSYLLHPPLLEAMGLAGAIEDYAQGFSARSGIVLDLEAPKDFGRLPEDMELALFRVVQESLANVLKHSGSDHARIRLTRHTSFVRLEVHDMGQGIPAEKLARIKGMRGGSGVGLAGMQERLRLLGGHLDIESAQSGTTVRATVPLPTAPPDSFAKT